MSVFMLHTWPIVTHCGTLCPNRWSAVPLHAFQTACSLARTARHFHLLLIACIDNDVAFEWTESPHVTSAAHLTLDMNETLGPRTLPLSHMHHVRQSASFAELPDLDISVVISFGNRVQPSIWLALPLMVDFLAKARGCPADPPTPLSHDLAGSIDSLSSHPAVGWPCLLAPRR